jgi:hypothetical protein
LHDCIINFAGAFFKSKVAPVHERPFLLFAKAFLAVVGLVSVLAIYH